MKAYKKPLKTFKKQRKKLFVVKISEVFCKSPGTLFKIAPVDLKCQALVTAWKFFKKSF